MLNKTLRRDERLVIGDVEILCEGSGRRHMTLRINAPIGTAIIHEKSGAGRPTPSPSDGREPDRHKG